METVSYSEARCDLKALMDRVVADCAPILVTRRRGENIVMISASQWAGVEETLHLMASPANARHLMDGIAQMDAAQGKES
jgi:antitoxin YefM